MTPHDLTIGRTADSPDDLQLSLFVLYELNYRGWDGVSDDWEWHPELIRVRGSLEAAFLSSLRALAEPYRDVVPAGPDATAIARTLTEMTSADDGPSLSKYLRGRATLDQFREFAMHRSVYHLREADPHTFAIPRLGGAAKAALIEIQIDEYGNGRLPRMHQELFRRTMTALHLDTTYGAYVDVVPAATLATNNVMSLFGLHRRLARGAARAPGRLRDDVHRAEPGVRQRIAAAGRGRRRHPLLRRARRGGRGARADRRVRHVRLVRRGGAGARRGRAVRGAVCAGAGRAVGHRGAGEVVGRASSLAACRAGLFAAEARLRRGGDSTSRPVPARKPIALWVPSQNGLSADFPHRHSATVPRPGSIPGRPGSAG